jgi:hypothetical protein
VFGKKHVAKRILIFFLVSLFTISIFSIVSSAQTSSATATVTLVAGTRNVLQISYPTTYQKSISFEVPATGTQTYTHNPYEMVRSIGKYVNTICEETWGGERSCGSFPGFTVQVSQGKETKLLISQLTWHPQASQTELEYLPRIVYLFAVLKPASNQQQKLVAGYVVKTAPPGTKYFLILAGREFDITTNVVENQAFEITDVPWYSETGGVSIKITKAGTFITELVLFGTPTVQTTTQTTTTQTIAIKTTTTQTTTQRCAYETQVACEQDQNCQWVGQCKGPEGICTGTPSACTSLTTESACRAAGCNWQYTYASGTKSFYCRDFGTVECSTNDPNCEVNFVCPEGLGCKTEKRLTYCCMATGEPTNCRTLNVGENYNWQELCPSGSFTVTKSTLSCVFKGGTYGGVPIREPIQFDCSNCRGQEADPFCRRVQCVSGPSCVAGADRTCSQFKNSEACTAAGCQWQPKTCGVYATKETCTAAGCEWAGCIEKVATSTTQTTTTQTTLQQQQPPATTTTTQTTQQQPPTSQYKFCARPFMTPVVVPPAQECPPFDWQPKRIILNGLGILPSFEDFVSLRLSVVQIASSGSLRGWLRVDRTQYELRNIVLDKETKSLVADIYLSDKHVGDISLTLLQKSFTPTARSIPYRDSAVGELFINEIEYNVFLFGRESSVRLPV